MRVYFVDWKCNTGVFYTDRICLQIEADGCFK